MSDFIGFTYNGVHSSELGIYRTSNGGRYDDNITATMNDKVAEVPGGDGQYYFGTTFTNRTFTVPFVFDNLTEEKIRLIKETFSGDGVHDLIFDEAPYKVWSAKVTGSATMKHLCFEENEKRIYKGEGNITFTCYYPYAHTPKETKSGEDGRYLSSYSDADYPNKSEWGYVEDGVSILPNAIDYDKPLQNLGDLPAPFIVKIDGPTEKDTILTVGGCQIKTKIDCNDLVWDSKTGQVTYLDNGERKLLPYSGNSIGSIPVGDNVELAHETNKTINVLNIIEETLESSAADRTTQIKPFNVMITFRIEEEAEGGFVKLCLKLKNTPAEGISPEVKIYDEHGTLIKQGILLYDNYSEGNIIINLPSTIKKGKTYRIVLLGLNENFSFQTTNGVGLPEDINAFYFYADEISKYVAYSFIRTKVEINAYHYNLTPKFQYWYR